MSFNPDDEILQDFLVEAGEILENLSGQLVELEVRAEDKELLNAIFRGFHTVKGGAGFLSLNSLVEVCHIAENVFDILRQGKRKVDSELMDIILQTLDTVRDMFAQIHASEEPSPATPKLLQLLHGLANVNNHASVVAVAETTSAVQAAPVVVSIPVAAPALAVAVVPVAVPDAVTTLAKAAAPVKNLMAEGDLITDDEFEALLDVLNNVSAVSAPALGAKVEAGAAVVAKPPFSGVTKVGSEFITDSEFEKLLDELHGKSFTLDGPPISASTAPGIAAPIIPIVPPAIAEVKSSSNPLSKIDAAKSEVSKFDHKDPADLDGEDGDKKVIKEASVSASETTVRVDTSRLDEIMNMVGELVLVRNRLVKLKDNSSHEGMVKAVANLDVVTADLQMAVMKTRMQPIKKVFGRFPRVVRDLARSLKKEIILEMDGEETDLDKNLVEALSDPLVHLVRNAVDHGIETPDVRVKAGKNRVGKIVLSAEQAGDHIVIYISDDGGGMDPELLRKKVVEKGIMDVDVAARLDEKECYNLIFLPGFSTKEQISDISGRGVGMDVVKTKITQLNGSLDIYSKKGEGSRISIKVPLTLAILPTLMVVVAKQTFALPLTSVNEIFHLDLRKTNVVDGQLVILVRDKAIPLFYLSDWLGPENDPRAKKIGAGHVVIVTVGRQRVGFVVDGLLGQEEVVIKALGDMLQGTPGMAGATITGDGRIAMILDVPSLLKRYALRSSELRTV